MKRRSFWHSWWGYVLCAALGHSTIERMYQKGNEDCDCGADHTYVGCSRCRVAV